jgi:hypothetical protein
MDASGFTIRPALTYPRNIMQETSHLEHRTGDVFYKEETLNNTVTFCEWTHYFASVMKPTTGEKRC